MDSGSCTDNIIDEASEVELVDLPPDELIKRLRQGKVYVPELIGQAIEKFFRKGNLIALRELSMRAAAERVDDQVRNYMDENAYPRSLGDIGAHSGMRWSRNGRNQPREGGEKVAANTQCLVCCSCRNTGRHAAFSLFNKSVFRQPKNWQDALVPKYRPIQGDSVAASLSEFAIKNYITKNHSV